MPEAIEQAPNGESARSRRAGSRAVASEEARRLSCIFVYKSNAERFAGSEEAIGDQIVFGLVHEAVAFFDLSDEQADELVAQLMQDDEPSRRPR
jgi:predicted Zn-dependent protease with MMP-like domain